MDNISSALPTGAAMGKLKMPATLAVVKKKIILRRMNTYVKLCPFCDKEFTCHNRRRRWCPDSNCKSMFYNLQNLLIYHRNKGVVKINERNRNILEAWFSAGKRTVSDVGLTETGFVFDAFFMHTYNESGSKDPVYEFLDYGLKDLGKGLFQIIQHQKQN